MSISTAFLAPPPDTEAAAQAMSQAGQPSTSNWSTKLEVADKVQLAISDFGNVARQLIKGSTSQEEVIKSARAFGAMEPVIVNSEAAIRQCIAATQALSQLADNQLASLAQTSALLAQSDVDQWAPQLGRALT